MKFWDLAKEVGTSGLVDIALMSMFVYLLLIWFKKRRAVFVLTGVFICGLIYAAAHLFHLFLITTILQAFSAVILIALIIIFQEELKYGFEQIAVWSLRQKIRKEGVSFLPQKAGNLLMKTLTDLARGKIGALVVLKGQDMLTRHLEGGVNLDGEISEPLLKSIFDPHSAGHDGAVVIDGDRLTQFGCHLPLSKNFRQMTRGGTRHAAALGLAELCDALCLVVSEETGKISTSRHGVITECKDEKDLRQILEKFYRDITPRRPKRRFGGIFTKNRREKGIAFVMTIGLWFVLVYESKMVQKTFDLPVQYAEPSSDLYVESVDPKEVQVTFSGPRHAFQFMNGRDVRLLLKLFHYQEGIWIVPVSDGNLIFPREMVLEEINPKVVTVEIEKK